MNDLERQRAKRRGDDLPTGTHHVVPTRDGTAIVQACVYCHEAGVSTLEECPRFPDDSAPLLPTY